MITEPLFYLVAIPAVLITGISKGGFGGLALFAVPLLSLVIPPVQAAGIMLPILLAMDVSSVYAYRLNWDKRNLLILLPGAIIGIGIATLTASLIQDDHVRLIVGAIAVLFSVNYWLQGGASANAKTPSKKFGFLMGNLSGYTSFVAHAGGPAFQLFVLPQKLDRKVYAGTAVMFFAVLNAVKLIPYTFLGLLDTTNLTTSLILIPLAPLGIFLGFWINRKLSNALFYKIIYAAIFLVGLRLIYQGLMS